MVDKEGYKVVKDYYIEVLFVNNSEGFYVKGVNSLDWGMNKYFVNIFDKNSGNIVMFVFDYGYFMGFVLGFERFDLLIFKLIFSVDVLMCIRGVFCICVFLVGNKVIVFCVLFGFFMLNDDLFYEVVVVNIEDVIRCNVDCMVV